MHLVEHVLLGLCVAELIVAGTRAGFGLMAAAFAHIALACALADASLALGGMPAGAEAALAVSGAGFAVGALIGRRRTKRRGARSIR
jgi:hypothetical protein